MNTVKVAAAIVIAAWMAGRLRRRRARSASDDVQRRTGSAGLDRETG